MLLSSACNQRPLLASTLGAARAEDAAPGDATPPGYYTEEEGQIRETQRALSEALCDLRRFLGAGPEQAPLAGSQVSDRDAADILGLVGTQQRQIEMIERQILQSELAPQPEESCFPGDAAVLALLRGFQGADPRALVSYADVVGFVESDAFSQALGVRGDRRSFLRAAWTPGFERRVLGLLRVKFGDVPGRAPAGLQLRGQDEGLSAYQLWLRCVVFWYAAGGEFVAGRGLVLNGEVGYAV